MQVRRATPVDTDTLIAIWRDAVRATHDFVTLADIERMTPDVRAALASLEVWLLEGPRGVVWGWMGLDGPKLEALFLGPAHHGHGGGRRLVDHARALKGPLTVDVNEQNPAARGFYEAMGFAVVGRSPLDAAGRPFPLLHMRERPLP
ncbi:MAG TPA: acetyltransferase [Tepidisphaeraceae bacterium]|nr:acetyltransferase [Tepidisphaeraceae bacterium]